VALLLVLCAMPSTVAAQVVWDPAAAVTAFSAAMNAHDMAAALALFDDNGSATDTSGRHFEGRAGLTAFLLGSGFGSPDASITTTKLIIAGNRAIWTFQCSCTAGGTEVRMVMLPTGKISVFAEMAPPGPPLRKADAGLLPWLLGLLAGTVIGGLGFGLARTRPRGPAPIPRASQGRLLSALAQARATRPYTLVGGADSDLVELPAAAITSLRSSDDSAGPWSRYRKHEAARPGSM
jgi:SnoaL-like protein